MEEKRPTPNDYVVRTAFVLQEAERALTAAKSAVEVAKREHHKALDIAKAKQGKS